MTTIVVWVLVMAMPGTYSQQPFVVDNIASQANCQALARMLRAGDIHGTAACIPVRKVRP